MNGWGVLYTETVEGERYRFYILVVVNDSTGTVHHIIFEAPIRTWDKHWSVVEPTMQRLLIDDEY